MDLLWKHCKWSHVIPKWLKKPQLLLHPTQLPSVSLPERLLLTLAKQLLPVLTSSLREPSVLPGGEDFPML